MRILKLMFASVAAATLLSVSAAQSAEPVKIRVVLGGAGLQLGLDPAGEEGPRAASRQILHAGAGALRRTPPMITALANGELEIANLASSTLAHRHPKCRHGRSAHHRRRIPRRRAGYYSQEYIVLTDGPIKKVEDLKGKVVADQRGRRRRRRRDPRDAAQARPRRQARLHRSIEAAVPDHARHARRKEGRPDPGRAAVLLRSGAAQDRAARCSCSATRSASRDMIVWTARKPFIDKNRAAMVDFMEDTLRITRWYLDPDEPQGGRGDRRPRDQAAARAVRLAVHQE